VGFYLSGHLFDAVEREVRRFVRRSIAEACAAREAVRDPRNGGDAVLLAGIVSDLRVIQGQRGRLALFKLDDKSAVIDARADDALLQAQRNLLRDDEFVVASGRLQPDRFSGGWQLSVQQLWSLGEARCRFGRYLRVLVGDPPPRVAELLAAYGPQVQPGATDDFSAADPLGAPFETDADRDVPIAPRGLPVRLRVERRWDGAADATDAPEADLAGVRYELALGDAARIFPSDAALAAWSAQAFEGQAEVVYE
jgi:DNA polymerase-3 subunit alpha